MAAPPAAATVAAAFSSPRLPAAATGERPQAVLGSRPAGRWRCRERQPSRAAGVCEEGASRGEPGWAARPRCGLTPPPARTEPAPPAPGAGGAGGTPVRRRHLAAGAAPAEPAAARGAGGSGRSAGNAPSGGAGSGGCRSAFLGRPPRCGGARPRRAEWGAAAARRSSSGPARPPPSAGGSGSQRQRLPGSRPGALRAAGRPRGLPEPFRINLDILLSDDSMFGDMRETGSCWNILQKPKALSNRESVGCNDRSQNVETSDIEAAVWERRAFTLFIISVILKNLAVWEVTAVSDSAHILFCVPVFQMPMIIITKSAGCSNFLLYAFVFPVSQKLEK
ncbi:uncharacterized protein [Taeniopygia guttata]|uniref:uncharacterized protein n=1 Tax=Taeniopygia guttata TaxID=59729 RepID=UPI003BB967AD